MVTRVSYPVEVKMKALQMKFADKSNEEIVTVLNIRNVSQIKMWMKWYKNNELYRLKQPVGKQSTIGKVREFES
ncbi:hypothetical protein KD050_18195 [Psychrobacillus sp. INOP01]|uniref:hypothetical protein n=1 Tax=Psychrobacillus sp. INOP01 TaxID=2829187 RepID=UPI001BA9509B|nr:hypothetical protein [Psychrobacillus sp. INOP01]QUG41193.1 hypothetical protein KD050_18195 [Psychrobacillus sp. INOP01]